MPIRVLMLVTELMMGGAARVVRDLSAMLAARFEVHEAVFNIADGVDFGGAQPLHSLDVEGGGGALAKLSNLRTRIRRARRLKRKLQIEVSISHLEGAHWVDVLSRAGEKIVLCVHGSILHNRDIRGASGWLRKRVLVPLLYNRADRVITVSRDLAPELRSLGVRGDKIRTINNGFDVRGITARSREPLGRDEAALFGHGPVLVTAGRLAPQKNHEALLEVFAELRRQRGAKLLILGDGDLRAKLIAQAEALGLRLFSTWRDEPLTADCDVYLLGVRSNPFNLIASADLFLLPSSWEGFPLALCEAMICGTPVMSTDCLTGPREILAPETRLLCTPLRAAERAPFGMLMPLLDDRTTEAAARRVWTDTILRLLDDLPERRRLSQAARGRMEDFTRERIAGQWAELITELASSSGRRRSLQPPHRRATR